jgi:hypothetical protein
MTKLFVMVNADAQYCVGPRGHECRFLSHTFPSGSYCLLWTCKLTDGEKPKRCHTCLGSELKEDKGVSDDQD